MNQLLSVAKLQTQSGVKDAPKFAYVIWCFTAVKSASFRAAFLWMGGDLEFSRVWNDVP